MAPRGSDLPYLFGVASKGMYILLHPLKAENYISKAKILCVFVLKFFANAAFRVIHSPLSAWLDKCGCSRPAKDTGSVGDGYIHHWHTLSMCPPSATTRRA
jgi:hypothetical protein